MNANLIADIAIDLANYGSDLLVKEYALYRALQLSYGDYCRLQKLLRQFGLTLAN